MKLLVDHHPYPLIVTSSNWLTMLDTAKYTELPLNCPYVPNIRAALPEHHYGDTLHLLTFDKVVTLSLDTTKKACSLKREDTLPI